MFRFVWQMLQDLSLCNITILKVNKFNRVNVLSYEKGKKYWGLDTFFLILKNLFEYFKVIFSKDDNTFINQICL